MHTSELAFPLASVFRMRLCLRVSALVPLPAWKLSSDLLTDGLLLILHFQLKQQLFYENFSDKQLKLDNQVAK